MKGLPVETALRAARHKGRKLLVPYVTGGLRDDWVAILSSMADAGADAIEVGLPFSDPMVDGPTIQEASLRALKRGEPLSEVSVFRYPGATWRRYDQMERFPAGLLVFGDAICTTNPIYGQGMTVAALEATALRECLLDATGDLRQRFFAAAADHIGPMWASNQFNDLYLANAEPAHSASKELLDFREAVLTAAESSPALTEKLFRSMNLVDPPTDYSPLLASGS